MYARTLWLMVVVTATVYGAVDNLDREIVLTPPSGSAAEDADIRCWQQRAEAPRATPADFERLGWAFVAKARRTLDAGYFVLAQKVAATMDAQFGGSDAAEFLRGHALHNLHRFREAETVARALVASRGLPDDFALLSDALMEQGRIDEAVAALQRAADLKPGAEVDTRIAHLRWLKGDLKGAIGAMEQAIRETSRADAEPMAWMLSQLCGFELERGNLERAATLADVANRHLMDFAPALLAQGRVALAVGKSEFAVGFLRRAAELNPLPEYRWWLTDALCATGAREEAAKLSREIAELGERGDPRTTALYLATVRENAPRAIELCRAELVVRGDVHTHDAMAWAWFAAGDVPRAETESREAMSLGTADSRMHLHAAVIAAAAARITDAQALLAKCEPAALRPSEVAIYREAMTRIAAAAPERPAPFAAILCRP